MAWNGDVYKAKTENKNINFIYPSDGFVLWIDCLAIPSHAPHVQEAYTFINFLLRPKIAAQLALKEGHPITNQEGKALLPQSMREDPILYPNQKTLRKAYVQTDVGEEVTNLYNDYWEKFKLTF